MMQVKPTKFTFPSPVYLQQDIEYCFVIIANTQDYHIWLSHMGDTEVGGTRTISDQSLRWCSFQVPECIYMDCISDGGLKIQSQS